MPAEQTPLLQSDGAPHLPMVGHLLAHEPPQSTSLSVPFFAPSMQVGTAHFIIASQTLLTQSVPTLHLSVSAQAGHLAPPQSASVSSWFCAMSEHVGNAQTPFAS